MSDVVNEQAAALIEKIRRRRGVRQVAAPKIERTMAQDGNLVRQKFGEFRDMTAAFEKFSSGSAYLPEPLKSEVTLFEGNFCPWARNLADALEKQLRKLA